MAYAISNQYANEGTASTDQEVSLPWPSQLVEIINDSGLVDLQYKFNPNETYATLKPLEVVNIYMHTSTIYLNGSGAYRIRVRG